MQPKIENYVHQHGSVLNQLARSQRVTRQKMRLNCVFFFFAEYNLAFALLTRRDLAYYE